MIQRINQWGKESAYHSVSRSQRQWVDNRPTCEVEADSLFCTRKPDFPRGAFQWHLTWVIFVREIEFQTSPATQGLVVIWTEIRSEIHQVAEQKYL